MRWYVSRNGETVGPVEDSVVAEWVRRGQLMPGTQLRDESGGPWMSVEKSPFATLLKGGQPGLKSALVVGLACGVAGFAFFGLSAGLVAALIGGLIGLAFGNVKLG